MPPANPAPAPSAALLVPRITVITPSYNQGEFLDQCIRSVLEQGYPNLEYLIFDGGSTDGSLGIIQAHAEKLAYSVSEPDQGQSDAINHGYQRATGELVAWLNSDDYYLPGALAAVAQAYRANPRASFYFGDGLRVDEAGTPIRSYFPDGRVTFRQSALVFGLNYILQPAAFINRQLLFDHAARLAREHRARQPQRGLFRRMVRFVTKPLRAPEIGPRLPDLLNGNLQYGMDSELWIRLAGLAPPMAIAQPLAASREYSRTKTASGSFARAEELRQIAEKYSGVPITPGALCYYLDTLHQFAMQREDLFPEEFLPHIHRFWDAVARLMARYGAGRDGFPTPPVEQAA